MLAANPPRPPGEQPGLAGLLFSGSSKRWLVMADRVVVFLDYQNVYSTARRAFHGRNAPPSAGQIDPARLAEHLVRNSPSPRHLLQVRIYRGEPSPRFDPVGNAAWHRQVAVWRRDPRVHVAARPIRYPRGYPNCRPDEKPQEKGIEVVTARSAARVEVAAGRRGNRWLTVPNKKLYCHWLRAQTYRLMQDLTACAR
jgi:hypothetical protein